jgi:anti-sigma factor RsiW
VGIQPEQLRLTPDERADLVAYVDGELPEAHSRVISTKLTQSATARREVEILQKTWEMLDYLPLPKATEKFADRTISQIRRLELKGMGAGAGPLVGAAGSGDGLRVRRRRVSRGRVCADALGLAGPDQAPG